MILADGPPKIEATKDFDLTGNSALRSMAPAKQGDSAMTLVDLVPLALLLLTLIARRPWFQAWWGQRLYDYGWWKAGREAA